MGRALRIGITLVGLLLAGVMLVLGWTHLRIRGVAPELPEVAAVLAAGAAAADRPIGITWLNTASQPVPRAAVLDPGSDPDPDAAYVMAFPVFVLEWRDGRRLLIDTGMDPATAQGFGRPLEIVAGAGPVETHGAVGDRLGAALRAPLALLFSHMHVDHTQGVISLCAARGADAAAVTLFQTRDQARRGNYTTRGGAAPLADAPCLERRELPEAALAAVPGRGGVFVIRAAGHTPGSQIVIAFVDGPTGPRGYAFTGDVVNHVEGARSGVPKPTLYRWLVVPEADARLGRLRDLLRTLEQRGLTLVVPHDQLHLESIGLRQHAAPAGTPMRREGGAFAPDAAVR